MQSVMDELSDATCEFQCKSILCPNYLMINKKFYHEVTYYMISTGCEDFLPEDPEEFNDGGFLWWGMTVDYRPLMKERLKVMYVGEGYDFADQA
jgi:hypothetical protein